MTDKNAKAIYWVIGVLVTIFLAVITTTHARVNRLEASVDTRITRIERFEMDVIKQLAAINTKIDFLINKRLK